MAKLKRTRLGFCYAFCVQYDGLKISASLYDLGQRTEAVRMANALFVLLGPESKNHKPIVEYLHPSPGFLLKSTAAPNRTQGSTLIAVDLVPYDASDFGKSGWIIHAKPFGHESLRTARSLSPSDWWAEGVLNGVGNSTHLTRLQLVRVMRDQDGGAHVDDHINDAAYLAAHLHGAGFMYHPAEDREAEPVEGTIEATIRQMATEVLESLRSLRATAGVMLDEAAKNGRVALQFFEQSERDRKSVSVLKTGQPSD